MQEQQSIAYQYMFTCMLEKINKIYLGETVAV
jgi:hypothetical protein